MAARPVERILNVIMTIGSRRRIDRARLRAVIPEYRDAASDDAFERMFERDKAEILELGISLRSHRDEWDDTVHYSIARAEDDAQLDVTPEEYAVLLAASRAWDDAAAGGAARRARAKLLSLDQDADPDLLRRTPHGTLESLPVLSPLIEAVTAQRTVRFQYRSASSGLAQRHVEPWVVRVHEGHWYVYGFDRDRQAPRLFRASRLESFPRMTGMATATRPEEIDLEAILHNIDTSDEAGPSLVQVEPYKAQRLRSIAGADQAVPELTLPTMPAPSTIRQVLSAARWATLITPGPWRERIAHTLQHIAELHAGDADLTQIQNAEPLPAVRIRAVTTGGETLSRLTAIVGYVGQRGEADIEKLAHSFGVGVPRIIQDLQVLFLCGDLGAGFEDLIEAEWDGGVVRVRNADVLHRALRLSASETTALLAGLGVLETAAGAQAEIVRSARTKLLEASATATEHDTATPASAAPQTWEQTVLTAIQASLRDADGTDGQPLVIRYSSPARRGTSVRRVHPIALETDGTRTYLRAHCELVGEERTFRVDRIVELLGEDARQHDEDPGDALDLSGRVSGEVWLRLEGPAAWIAEAFEARERREAPDAGSASGAVLVRLDGPVRHALVDAVLEAGGAAQVLTPRDLRDMITVSARDACERHTAS
ncbi:WYL domain-containing protein [Brachybacterium timonense]|uniref:WYL domain-containing protein n=1 Tax=Brachybacterium timonense TaxID=2050896 RepID=UPI001FEBFDCE|nr:WYL domain-containing protein [Brachybacterium timonense]